MFAAVAAVVRIWLGFWRFHQASFVCRAACFGSAQKQGGATGIGIISHHLKREPKEKKKYEASRSTENRHH